MLAITFILFAITFLAYAAVRAPVTPVEDVQAVKDDEIIFIDEDRSEDTVPFIWLPFHVVAKEADDGYDMDEEDDTKPFTPIRSVPPAPTPTQNQDLVFWP